MRTAYFDCFSGAAGDMILAAYIDCGLSVARLKRALAALKLEARSFALTPRKVVRCGVKATYLDVRVRKARRAWTSYAGLRRLIDRSRLSSSVKNRASRVFYRLARAESVCRGVKIDRIHFHELSAIDSIVDIVGASLAMDLLEIDRISFGNVHVGSGTARTARGECPIPSPVVLELFRDRPITLGGPEGEIMTPTGAAILTTLGTPVEFEPAIQVKDIGYGAGKANRPGRPNVLRLVVGEAAGYTYEEDRITVIEANIDDMLPLNFELIFDALFRLGALDVTLAPVQMKKQRPAVRLSVLTPPSRRMDIAGYLLRETSSLGVRFSDWGRVKMRRRMTTIRTRYGTVRVKLGFLDDRVFRASPEYEDCKRLAHRKNVSFLQVYENAKETARIKFVRRPHEKEY